MGVKSVQKKSWPYSVGMSNVGWLGKGHIGGGTVGDIRETEGTVTCPVTAMVVGVTDADGMAVTGHVTVPSVFLMSHIVPPPLCPLPSQPTLDMPTLYGQDLFWTDFTPVDQKSAVVRGPNDF